MRKHDVDLVKLQGLSRSTSTVKLFSVFISHFKDNYGVVVAMEALMAALAIVEAIVAIWGSALCCKSGVCCCSRPVQTVGTMSEIRFDLSCFLLLILLSVYHQRSLSSSFYLLSFVSISTQRGAQMNRQSKTFKLTLAKIFEIQTVAFSCPISLCLMPSALSTA